MKNDQNPKGKEWLGPKIGKAIVFQPSIFRCELADSFREGTVYVVVSKIIFYFHTSSLFGEMIQFDYVIFFQMGWNHQLV